MGRFQYYVNKCIIDRFRYINKILYFQIHLTNNCINHCSHCYFNELGISNKEMDYNKLLSDLLYFKSLAKKINKELRVDFTGGDPFLYSNFGNLIKFCDSNEISYGLKCNGDLLLTNANMLKVIRNAKEISLSLDGMRETHDKIRSVGSFDRTLSAIKLLKENNFRVRISFTASKSNILEILPLYQFLLKCNFRIDDFTWARYWSVDKDIVLSNEELIKEFIRETKYFNDIFENEDFYYYNAEKRKIPKIIFSFKEHTWIPYFIESNYLLEDMVKKLLDSENSLNCTGRKNIFIEDVDGSIYNCRKINDSKFKIDIKSETNLFKLPYNKQCKNCFYFNVCGGCEAIFKVYFEECILFRERR